MKKRNYSEDIANKIINFLNEDDWHFYFDEEQGLFKFNLALNGIMNKIQYTIIVGNNDYNIYAISLINANIEDTEMMATMAEFICRINYGVKNGNFEMDMDDGEIRFKVYVDCADATPTAEIIRNSLYIPSLMFEHYGNGIINIMFSNFTAVEAIKVCKKSINEKFVEFSERETFETDENIEEMFSQLEALLDSDDDNASISDEPKHDETIIKTNLFES